MESLSFCQDSAHRFANYPISATAERNGSLWNGKRKRSMIKRLIVVVLWPLLASAQNGSPTPAQTQSPGPVPAADATPGNESQSAESVVDQIERLVRERENAEAASTAQLPPDKPRTHRFTNQPIAKVLRILADQAGLNYVEPN